MASHPLFTILGDLKGNARACVLTEPLWGIPYNLYIPYVSVYMLTLGLTDRQIGLVISIGWGFQVIAALFSGVVTDKLGRKRATFLFDLLAWSIPVLIWAFAQNFTWFVAAAVANSAWRITSNSWTCLLVEDTDSRDLVDIYAWIYIAGLLAVFFAPLAGLLIGRYTLVTTMRGLYLLSFVLMTAKFVIMNEMVSETDRGLARMEETRHLKVVSMLNETRAVLRQLLHTPETLYTLGIMLIVSISNMINSSFWSIIATQRIGIPDSHLALYPFVRALIMLIFFFLVIPRMNCGNFRLPMLAGFLGFGLSHLVLISVPSKNYLLLLVSTVLEACSYAAINPQLDRLVAVTVDPQERARIQSLLYMAIIIFTAPFGWVAGLLSSIDRTLPFILNIVLFAIGAVLVARAARFHARSAVDYSG